MLPYPAPVQRCFPNENWLQAPETRRANNSYQVLAIHFRLSQGKCVSLPALVKQKNMPLLTEQALTTRQKKCLTVFFPQDSSKMGPKTTEQLA